ncbi:MAG: cell envelope integrity protein CreD [Pseudomonadota bacterium]
MLRSAGIRFIVVGALALLMFVPLGLVGDVIKERARYSETTIRDISQEWGGSQLLSGPVLVIPVTEEVTYERKREAVDPVTGRTLRDERNFVIYDRYEETVTEARAHVFLYPEEFALDVTSQSQTRKRGIFAVPVFTADLALDFNFDTDVVASVLNEEETPDWEAAELRVHLGSNRALRGETVLAADANAYRLEPIPHDESKLTGIYSKLGDPRELGEMSLKLSLNGAQVFGVAAVGRVSRMTLASDWPDPSFFGSFLPDTSDISEEGFSATWTVPHLARSLPQVSREMPDDTARRIATMQVKFLTPNEFYQKAWRAARYGILFIALTFLTILLLDRTNERPAHPVQYLMVGLAQSIFILLMVAYAEQIGFGAAYALAAGATIGLLGMFGATALKLGRRTGVLVGMLVAVYGVLFMILRSADYALLAGATFAFVALALTMWLTRNEEWSGGDRPMLRWPARRSPKPGIDPAG